MKARVIQSKGFHGAGAALALAIMVAAALALSACAPSTGGGTVARGATGVAQHVVYGTVVGVREVQIEGTRSGIGAGAGAIAGGAAGSQIGQGSAANIAGAVGGAVIGGILGAAIEEGATRGRGFEYTIETDDGRIIAVIQGDDMFFAPGERVQVIYGQRTRVMPAGPAARPRY
jgi:outer membrane lipoprotein SlyB